MSKNKFKISCCMVIMIFIYILFLNYINKMQYGKNPKYGDFKISLLNNNRHVYITEEEKNEIFNYIVNELENEEHYVCDCSLSYFDLAKGKSVKIALKNHKFTNKFMIRYSDRIKGVDMHPGVDIYQRTDKIYIDLDKRLTNCSTIVSEDVVEFLDKYFN